MAAREFEKAIAIRQDLAAFLAAHNAERSSTYIQRTCLDIVAKMPPSPVVASLLRDIGKKHIHANFDDPPIS